MYTKFLSLSLLLLAVSCTQNTSGNGTASNGQLLSANFELSANKLYVERYIIEFPDQTKCVTAPTPKQLRAKQRSFPMTCTNGSKGTANFNFTVQMGGNGTTVLSFALDNGVTGVVTFAGGWEV